MRFKVEENLPAAEIAALLSSAGHEAMSVHEQRLAGAKDPALISACSAEGRILITLDLGFSDIRIYPPQSYPGVVVLRLRRQDKPYVLSFFRTLLPVFEREPLNHRTWIAEEGRVRIRGE